MQVFPPTKHQISDLKRTGNRRYQPSRYDHFYSPIHLRRSFRPPLLVGLPEGYQIFYASQPIRYTTAMAGDVRSVR
jgi:hypothetical protein